MYNLVIFGASGDLTSRKLIPALFNLFVKKRLPQRMNIIGFARTAMTSGTWQNQLAETTRKYTGNAGQNEAHFDTLWREFAPMIHYCTGDITDAASFQPLRRLLEELENGADASLSAVRLFYLAVAPEFYGTAAEQLGAAGLAEETPNRAVRIVIEKPFGTDLTTARKLNETVHRHFGESQIYRIDHYLGKETVNNILVLRFANTIFEPIWNRNYIDNIQITANENTLVGRRAPYYETAGILRDMFQNHLLQILTFVTMEAPSRFDAKSIRDEKVKVLQSIRLMQETEVMQNSFRGQYNGYRQEPGVKPDSITATFGAVRLFIDNWRWKHVPVYLRSGKGMPCRTTQVVINFHCPPHSMFQGNTEQMPAAHTPLLQGNRLLLQLQPAEGIQISFMSKVPDADMHLRSSELLFNFKDQFRGEMPDSYERLLLDALHGDASLYARNDEVEAAWQIIDPIQSVWDNGRMPPPELYNADQGGPDGAYDWIKKFGQSWFDLCPVV
ncbi:MAG: glucose-6-phosphate dehydrogenase [Planctomycetaceae bacterium]|jgi:glucose-6-phosphate 1-dehydrogenase|nr:glucose-6-phosphate dehydrogenase [Planctomycetaceae bacterium]